MRIAAGIKGLLLIPAMLAGTANADVLFLASGDRLTGEIDSIGGGKVILMTDFAGTIGVKLETVVRMESETLFEIRRTDGEKFRGQFIADGDDQQFKPEDGAAESLDLGALASARQNNLGIRDLGSDWTNRFDAGVSASSGNTDTASQNYLIESILTRSRSRHRFDLTFDTQEDDGVKTRENFLTSYDYRRFFRERWYGTGNIGYEQDKFRSVDSRWSLGVGVGYQFWDDSTGALTTDLGISYVVEDLVGVEKENPALRWGLEYDSFFLAKRAEFFYNQSVLFIPENDRRTIYHGSTGLRFNLTDMLTANLRVDLAHETNPPDDLKKTDLTYVMGIGLVF